MAAPLPGRRENSETTIVIASAAPLEFEGVAPAAWPPGAPADGDGFSSRLSRLDLSHAAAAILPYRVTAW